LVLRHGEVAKEFHTYLYGQRDVALSEKGKLQSQQTGRYLQKYKIDVVYASDLSRARYLGNEVAKHHGLRPIIDTRIRERNLGLWQDLTWDQVSTQYPKELEKYCQDRFATLVPGNSENFIHVRQRIRSFLDEIIPRHPGQVVAITCHSGPARVILAEALEMPTSSIFTFEQEYCCLNEIDIYPDGRWRVNSLNHTEHLEGV
jgi:broad specificity phosphatase PhoE